VGESRGDRPFVGLQALGSVGELLEGCSDRGRVRMRGVLFPGSKSVVVREFDVPEPGPGQVRVAVKAAGLCGSDLTYVYRVPEEERNKVQGDVLAWPLSIAGHEPCGIIDSVGEGVDNLKTGDRVVIYHITGCGHCVDCREGWEILCSIEKHSYGYDIAGAFADYMLADAKNCIPLPDNISFAEGAYYACGAGTAYQALKRASLAGDETMVVFGLGPVGLAAVLFGGLRGARVIAIDPIEERAALAREHGAEHVMSPLGEDVVERVMDLTGGIGADVTMDCSGNSVARNNALDCVRTWGRTLFVGEGNETTIKPSPQILHKQLTLIGSWVFSIPGLQKMLRDVSRQGVKLEGLITHRFDVSEARSALETFDAGKTGKVVFQWT
jgi:propanol-preferring alcohol dehydrogenase